MSSFKPVVSWVSNDVHITYEYANTLAFNQCQE